MVAAHRITCGIMVLAKACVQSLRTPRLNFFPPFSFLNPFKRWPPLPLPYIGCVFLIHRHGLQWARVRASGASEVLARFPSVSDLELPCVVDV
jgi:hypothetical protein